MHHARCWVYAQGYALPGDFLVHMKCGCFHLQGTEYRGPWMHWAQGKLVTTATT